MLYDEVHKLVAYNNIMINILTPGIVLSNLIIISMKMTTLQVFGVRLVVHGVYSDELFYPEVNHNEPGCHRDEEGEIKTLFNATVRMMLLLTSIL